MTGYWRVANVLPTDTNNLQTYSLACLVCLVCLALAGWLVIVMLGLALWGYECKKLVTKM